MNLAVPSVTLTPRFKIVNAVPYTHVIALVCGVGGTPSASLHLYSGDDDGCIDSFEGGCMSLALVLLVFCSDVSFLDKVQIDHDGAERPFIRVDDQKNVWLWDYVEPQIQKFGADGKPLLILDGKRECPYPMRQSRELLVLGQRILVLNGDMVLEFEAGTGRFLRKLAHMPMTSLIKWDHDRALIAFGGYNLMVNIKDHQFAKDNFGNPDHSFHLLGEKGIEDGWNIEFGPLSEGPSAPKSAVLKEREVYFLLTSDPVVRIYKLGKRSPVMWRLKPPKGYQAPPDHAMPLEYRYKPHKVEDFYNGFCKVVGMALVDEDYLAVCWQRGSNRGFFLDVYRLEDQVLMVRNVPIPGKLFGAVDNELFIFEDRDTEDVSYWVHRYKWAL